MAMMRLRYVHSFVDKTGRVRFYFRHRGKRWPLPGQPGSTEFAARYDELRRECLTASATDNVAFGPNTLGQVIEKYIAHTDFTAKAPGTRRFYRATLDQLKEICGRALIADLREKHIREIRKRFTATSTADLAVMLLRMLWSFAKERLALDIGPNPATDIKNLHKRLWSHEPWPDWVIEKFEAVAEPKPNAQLALLLLMYTGQRASDVARMRWEQYDGKGIAVRQQKTGALLWIPCHSRLRRALDGAERGSAFILTARHGSGYTADGLCKMIAAATDQIGAKECTAHDLRCNAAVALAEVGCTIHQIMSVTGHKTFKEALRYTQQAAQKTLAQQAIDQLETKSRVANPRTSRDRRSG